MHVSSPKNTKLKSSAKWQHNGPSVPIKIKEKETLFLYIFCTKNLKVYKLAIISTVVYSSKWLSFLFSLEDSCTQDWEFRTMSGSMNPPTWLSEQSGSYMWYHSVIKWRPELWSFLLVTEWASLLHHKASYRTGQVTRFSETNYQNTGNAAKETAQEGICLPCKHEDKNSVSGTKELDMVVHIYNLRSKRCCL